MEKKTAPNQKAWTVGDGPNKANFKGVRVPTKWVEKAAVKPKQTGIKAKAVNTLTKSMPVEDK
jgi:hypothetical protein